VFEYSMTRAENESTFSARTVYHLHGSGSGPYAKSSNSTSYTYPLYGFVIYTYLMCPMFVISIETKLLAQYFNDISLFILNFKKVFFAVMRCVIVVYKMFAEVYNNTGMGNTRRDCHVAFVSCCHARVENSTKLPTSSIFFTDAAKVALS
jgi:hypothetical protein